MKPKFFGESHDLAKRQIMKWLAPSEPWVAHPMWFDQRPEDPDEPDFLEKYSAVLDVQIVDGNSRYWNDFPQDAERCHENLLLDPDTGLWTPANGRRSRKHVTVAQFVQIAISRERQDKLTLIYDQSYIRSGHNIRTQTEAKLRTLRGSYVHSVAYIAHEGSNVRFIWASTDRQAITEATQRIQTKSGFPRWRFVDDGCGHVRDDPPLHSPA